MYKRQGKYGSGTKILTTGCPCPAAKSVMGVYHKAGQPVIKIFMATVLKIVEQTADARKETEDFIIRNSIDVYKRQGLHLPNIARFPKR